MNTREFIIQVVRIFALGQESGYTNYWENMPLYSRKVGCHIIIHERSGKLKANYHNVFKDVSWDKRNLFTCAVVKTYAHTMRYCRSLAILRTHVIITKVSGRDASFRSFFRKLKIFAPLVNILLTFTVNDEQVWTEYLIYRLIWFSIIFA